MVAGAARGLPGGDRGERGGQPRRAGRGPLRRADRPHRPEPCRPGRDLPRRGGRRGAQGDRALRDLAGHRGADDGPAAAGRPVRQHLARTTRTGSAVARFDLAMPGRHPVRRRPRRRGAGRPWPRWARSRVLVVTGRTPPGRRDVRAALAEAGIATAAFAVAAEPSIELVRDGRARWPPTPHCDAVLGFGGGSALDVAKAAAVLAATGADPLDHLEVIGAGRPITEPGLPCVAVPTTAGTGSEVTRNAVLSGDGVKASLRSPLMLPAGRGRRPRPAGRRAAADDRRQRDGRAVPADRAAAVRAGQPVHRRAGPGRHPPLGPLAAPGVHRRHGRPRRTRGPRPGQPVRRAVPGQLRARRRARARRRGRGPAVRAARRGLCRRARRRGGRSTCAPSATGRPIIPRSPG